MKTFRFENEGTNKSWMVKVIEKGDKYGLNNCLTHDKPANMVEFYDTSKWSTSTTTPTSSKNDKS